MNTFPFSRWTGRNLLKTDFHAFFNSLVHIQESSSGLPIEISVVAIRGCTNAVLAVLHMGLCAPDE